MLELIKTIFTDNDLFVLNQIDDLPNVELKGFVAMPNKNSKKEFYIVIELQNLTPFFDKEFDIVVILNDWIKSSPFYNENFNKNTTLLVIYKSQYPIEERIRRQVFEIEEDPFFFKKYVITYSENQIEELNLIGIDSIDTLYSLVNALDFESFKMNPSSDNHNSLLLNLFVKIPFLKVPFQEKELENLLDKINRKIQNSTTFDDLVNFHQKCLDTNQDDVFEIFEIPKLEDKNEL